MEAQRLSAIMILFDIFIHEDILFMSRDDIFIIAACFFIMSEQRLLFIIAVLDMRLHDIIVFMSAREVFMPDIEEWFIVVGSCAWTEVEVAAAKARKAKTVRADVMLNLMAKCVVRERTPPPFDPAFMLAIPRSLQALLPPSASSCSRID